MSSAPPPDAAAIASRLVAMLPRPVGIPVIVPGRATGPAVAQHVVASIKRCDEVLIIPGLVLTLPIGMTAVRPMAPPTSD